MYQYRVITNDGQTTIVAENLHKAWELATATYTDVKEIQFIFKHTQ